MRTLGPRLHTVQALVPKGSRVADIGTDHGHLPISLIRTGVAASVIASDIREKPLDNARKNIEKTHTPNIELRLGAGLSTVQPDEVDCITVAGMGGEVIASVLEAAAWIRDEKYTLILQAMTSADLLRRYLSEKGFKIETEVAVLDADKLYSVMKVRFRGVYKPQTEAYYRIGELSAADPIARLYIEKQVGIVKKCIYDLEKSGRDSYQFKLLLDEMEKRL